MEEQNIILIGFMGAGKTSVGEALARRRGRKLIDTDWLIEEKAGMAISELFEKQGEAAFRQLETEVLMQLISEASGDVISVGGGLPMREENRELLKKLGTVVYLSVTPETVLKRLEGDTTRPLLAGEHPERKVRELLDLRTPIYKEACHFEAAVDGRTVEELADEIERGVERI